MKKENIWIVRRDEKRGDYNAVAGERSRRFPTFEEAVEWLEQTRSEKNWCPFCGTDNSGYFSHGSLGYCRTMCAKCGATGPIAGSETEAWKLWLQRPEEDE